MANELSLAQKLEMSAKNMNGGCPKKKSINLFPYPQVEKTQATQDTQTFLSPATRLLLCIRFINVTKVFVFFFEACLRLSPNVAPPWDPLCFLSIAAVFLNAQQQLDNNKGVTVLLLFLSHSRTSFVQIT